MLQSQTDQSPGGALNGSVIGVSSSNLLSRLTLNKGTQDSVMINMFATVPQGLVGVVVESSRSTSVVHTVLDPQARIGITVRVRCGQAVSMLLSGDNIWVFDFIEVE